MQSLELRGLSDYHVHFRQGEMTPIMTWWSSRMCNRALAMPNTLPPVVTPQDAEGYYKKLTNTHHGMEVILATKLTPDVTPEMVKKLAKLPYVKALKLYPRGVTTNSSDGISAEMLTQPPKQLLEVFAAMADEGLILSIHGVMPGAFCMDGEQRFVPLIYRISDNWPHLKIILEHISTAAGLIVVRILSSKFRQVAGTITLHHLYLTLDEIRGNMHHYCEPIPQTPADRAALRHAVLSGEPCFFFGSDSAPHHWEKKYCIDACPGVFTAPVLPALAQFFEEHNAMDRMENFTSTFGDNFYGLPHTERVIRLEKEEWTVPLESFGIVPFNAGKKVNWKLGT